MKPITIDLVGMAHGGTAVARGKKNTTIFVPNGIPGEKVRVKITRRKNNHSFAEILTVLQPSADRIEPHCSLFTICGGCHFQHIDAAAQLRIKQDVIRDQMARIGNIKNAPVARTLPNPTPWEYRHEIKLSRVEEGGLGFWSPSQKKVIPIDACPVAHPKVIEFLQDVDLDLPGLRRLSLRIGDDEAMLAAIEVDRVEPPLLKADFPVSVAMVLPDKTAVSLVGDHYTVMTIKGHDFRISPGCYFPPSVGGMELVIDTVLRYANLTEDATVLDWYSGVGILSAFLAEQAAAVIGVESNPDAVADTAVNLAHTNNVSLFEGQVEEMPLLDEPVDVMVLNPPKFGLSREAADIVSAINPARIVYVSSDVATMARDGRKLIRNGYKLIEIQPIDMQPQTFFIETVSLWEMEN